ncbi:MAG: hypothetical protein ACD_37C00591G0003 [uncultured bacterium]|nr:MAG: hypothetical protein ACD_37C00591G0003 [uncultured bacterium]OFW91265.1 MAG: hypothetical protein A2W46_02580 [Alphaproteobacteria bacterium RIFCSPHIGHO2_12_42_13]
MDPAGSIPGHEVFLMPIFPCRLEETTEVLKIKFFPLKNDISVTPSLFILKDIEKKSTRLNNFSIHFFILLDLAALKSA